MTSTALTEKQFEDFKDVIQGTLGIKMPPTKRVMLQSRLHRRLRELGLDTFEEYHNRFFGDPEHRAEELEHLLNLATTNKTDFFREPDHFDVLAREVLPAWLKAPRGSVFRVWCAGCSTGEECYTIAMTLMEQQERTPFQFSILATDVSTRVLHIAMEAVYAEEHIAPIPPMLRSKYLLRSKNQRERLVRIAPHVREKVRFGHLNFLSPAYGLKDMMDVIFFRNVMIYFDRETQTEVVGKMCLNLHEGGTLFIAHAETLQGLPLPLKLAGTSVYRRLKKGATA